MSRKRLTFTPSPLTLGTAQLGMDYGVANQLGMPSLKTCISILDQALASGISTFDTAQAYGRSERRLGDWLQATNPENVTVITKLPKIDAASPTERADSVGKSINRSLAALKLRTLQIVLTHRGQDLLHPEVHDALLAANAAGTIESFGASVYAPDIALKLIETTQIAAIQLPLSLADQRFVTSGVLKAADEKGIAVFARSIFLQGALLMDAQNIPDFLSELAPRLQKVDAIAKRLDCRRATLLLAAVMQMPTVSSCVIGVEQPAQLTQHLDAIHAPPIPGPALAEVQHIFNGISPSTLDPGRWPR